MGSTVVMSPQSLDLSQTASLFKGSVQEIAASLTVMERCHLMAIIIDIRVLDILFITLLVLTLTK